MGATAPPPARTAGAGGRGDASGGGVLTPASTIHLIHDADNRGGLVAIHTQYDDVIGAESTAQHP